ncbi:Nif3-like dinuclear metal center hexameric protein [Jeotgalicoccus sp. WY2]|uniref:Nif3-like dinuclear metal center hexameric protein n=1 Tax=Jeotgalicoccus sp. WY2 TaxID=2708346 RepID=UPI002021C898|nr:Nif3-like dinuclear metal center hexameric protein [Jeotgalicoccus sp. WY2]
MLKISDLLKQLNGIAPFSDSEKWDNTGLLVGNEEDTVTGIITALDCSADTVDEAVMKNASYYPIIL